MKVDAERILTAARWAKFCEDERQRNTSRGYLEVPQTSGRAPWLFGFLLQAHPINVKLPNLETTVYRVQGFFPYDEDPTEFMFEL